MKSDTYAYEIKGVDEVEIWLVQLVRTIVIGKNKYYLLSSNTLK